MANTTATDARPISGAPPTPDTAEAIEALGPWFHNLHLPDGTQTRPDHPWGDFPAFKWRKLCHWLPDDLAGWTALDLGCNAGFYSIELARRGADVVGVDVDAHYLAQARWASTRYSLPGRIEFRQMTVYDLAHEQRAYDLVLFMGLLYHLRYPLLALDIVAERVKRLLVLQTLQLPGDAVLAPVYDSGLMEREHMLHPGWPKMAFVEHRLAGDPTNWWVPNRAAVEAMLRSAGMRVVGYPFDEAYLAEPDPKGRASTGWMRPELMAAEAALACRVAEARPADEGAGARCRPGAEGRRAGR